VHKIEELPIWIRTLVSEKQVTENESEFSFLNILEYNKHFTLKRWITIKKHIHNRTSYYKHRRDERCCVTRT
jgi:hypothetical protein